MLTKEEIKKYKSFISKRQGYISIEIKEALKDLLRKNKNIEEVYLVGSFANGDWVKKDSPEWFKKIRKKLGKNKEVSDIDFFSVPQVKSSDNYEVLEGYRKNSILIYKNNKILI
jgi:predicted nucleotidyltransferase